MKVWICALIAGILLGLPLATFADDAVTNTTSNTGSELQSSGNTGVSPATSGLLQPTVGSNGSALQPTGSDGTGQSTANQSNTLQQPASSDQAKLFIAGSVDSTGQLGTPPNLAWLLYILLVLGMTTGLVGVLWLVQRRALLGVQQTTK